MCGILGIVGNTKSFSQASIDAMLLTLAKRGPEKPLLDEKDSSVNPINF